MPKSLILYIRPGSGPLYLFRLLQEEASLMLAEQGTGYVIYDCSQMSLGVILSPHSFSRIVVFGFLLGFRAVCGLLHKLCAAIALAQLPGGHHCG